MCGTKRHTKTEIRSKMSELICGRIAAGENYNLTRDTKSGDAFEVLGKKMLAYLPEKRDAVEQISKSFEFREPFLVKNDRVQLLSDVVRGNAKRILK